MACSSKDTEEAKVLILSRRMATGMKDIMRKTRSMDLARWCTPPERELMMKRSQMRRNHPCALEHTLATSRLASGAARV